MRKLLLLMLIVLGLPASAATIKFFTDYPNSVPIGSDFFVLQRNNSYINASRDQVKADWFNNPVFGGIIYGNGIGITNVNATGTNADFTYITNFTLYSTNIEVQNINVTSNITVQTVITTNVFTTNLTATTITNNTFVTTNVTIQFPGGMTNLNLTPKTVMFADINDAESSIPNAIGVLTNDGAGGVGFSSTLQLDELDVTRAYLTNLFTGLTNYSVLGTDGNGLLTLGSGITNLTITNLTVQNLYADTNFTTNLYFVSGKGNTLIVTNTLFVTNGISALNLNPNQFVASDANDKLVSTLDGSSLTNFVYRYTTNAVTGLTLTFGKQFFTNVSTANITFTAINAQDLAAMETVCLRCTNSSGSDWTVTLPNGIGSPGLGKPPVITITNKQECRIFIQHDGNQSTNCWFIPTY